jgi:hypothetical protein
VWGLWCSGGMPANSARERNLRSVRFDLIRHGSRRETWAREKSAGHSRAELAVFHRLLTTCSSQLPRANGVQTLVFFELIPVRLRKHSLTIASYRRSCLVPRLPKSELQLFLLLLPTSVLCLCHFFDRCTASMVAARLSCSRLPSSSAACAMSA